MSIKAIETRYKGYRFRSRLEARWAVFFDTLGVKWDYEKEGYDLGKSAARALQELKDAEDAPWEEDSYSDGVKLPDYALERIARYEVLAKITEKSKSIEGAGNPFYLPDFWLPKYQCFVEIKPTGISFVGKDYREGKHDHSFWDISDFTLSLDQYKAHVLSITSGFPAWVLCGNPYPGELTCYLVNRGTCISCPIDDYTRVPGGIHGKDVTYENLAKAYNAARSARFEHGESGGE